MGYIEKGKADWEPYSQGNCIYRLGTQVESECILDPTQYSAFAPGSKAIGENCHQTCPVQPAG